MNDEQNLKAELELYKSYMENGYCDGWFIYKNGLNQWRTSYLFKVNTFKEKSVKIDLTDPKSMHNSMWEIMNEQREEHKKEIGKFKNVLLWLLFISLIISLLFNFGILP